MPSTCGVCGSTTGADARYCARCGAPLAVGADGASERLRAYLPRDLAARFLAEGASHEGEQRLVTVLFVDIVRSTELMRELGAESMADLLDDLLARVAKIVYTFEGTIIDVAGDGALCVFGAPISHEDDAARALRSSLAILDAVGAIGGHARAPEVRMGVDSGNVVPRSIGRDYRLKYSAIGDAVHLAQRLQSAAGPGEVVVSTRAMRLAGAGFRFGPPERLALKGFDESHEAARLLGEAASSDRRARTAGAPFIGRDAELARAIATVDGLVRGKGGVLAIWGEAGIGKSRLVDEIRDRSPRAIRWIEARAASYEQNAPFSLLAQQVRAIAEISPAQSDADARTALREAVLRSCGEGPLPTIYPFLATALALEVTPAERAVIERAGPELPRAIGGAFCQLVLASANGAPLVVVFDDLHWADTASLTAPDELLSATAAQPVLVFLSGRPDPESPSFALRRSLDARNAIDRVEITLDRLSSTAMRRLAFGLLDGADIDARARDLLLAKAEGVPLFLEELVASLTEQGALTRGVSRTYTLVSDPAIPDTLQGIILARIDRLAEPAKRVLEVASIVGPTGQVGILEELVSPAELAIGLAEVSRLDLFHASTTGAEPRFAFKHVLIRDVAYATLLGPKRKELHRTVAGILVRWSAGWHGESDEIIGEHFLRAEEWKDAARHLARAGAMAARLYAHAEARRHYTKTLEALAHLPNDRERERWETDAIIQLVSVSFVADGPRRNLQRLATAEPLAKSLAERADADDDDVLRLARVHYWLGRANYYAGRPRVAFRYFDSARAVGARFSEEQLGTVPAGAIGEILLVEGEFERALPVLRDAAAHVDHLADWTEATRVWGYLGIALAGCGNFGEGVAEGERALARALQSDNLTAIGTCRVHLCVIHLFTRDSKAMAEHASAAIDVAARSGDHIVAYTANGFLAWAESRLGRHDEAAAAMARSKEIGAALASENLIVADLFDAAEAEIALNAGRFATAAALAERAVAAGEAANNLLAQGLAHRTWAQAEAAAGSPSTRLDPHFERSAQLLDRAGCHTEAGRTRADWTAARTTFQTSTSRSAENTRSR